MLHGWAICLGILCVFSIASTVLAQSQSATETIIDRIYQSEGKVREHVDTKVADINKEISAVDTKVDNLSTTVGTLSADVRENKTNIENMKENIRDLKGKVDKIWYGILGVLGTLILSIAGYFFKSLREGRGKVDSVDVVDRFTEQVTNLTAAQAEQIANLTAAQTKAQAEISAQISRLISAQAEISETRGVPGDPKVPGMEGLDEVTDDIQYQQHDAGERV
ncbi:hypothetical protein F4009_15795 [Candidatus Poribacteria bacterium]|nr:hypothetical protein [Candidatus Poribacteria bacterium]MYH84045.1 hypothetical protein [Candidatus Poribacteria bacterium]MYK95436.1 hypothetical protein [Candidatus Poribacteria bacterium]